MPTWDDVVALGTRFPGVEVGTSFRTPALRVRGKGMCRLRTEPDALVLRVSDLGEREALLQGQPDASSRRRTTTAIPTCSSGWRKSIPSSSPSCSRRPGAYARPSASSPPTTRRADRGTLPDAAS